jgi:hypothetical protein
MMLASPSRTDIVQQPRKTCESGDDALRIAALKILQTSGYTALRRLRCEVAEAVVIIRGVLPTYYLKQMAQAVIQHLDGIRSVRNLVEVRDIALVQSVNGEEGIDNLMGR